MKKTLRTFLMLFLLVMGTAMSRADFKNFSAILNNQSGTLIEASEQEEKAELKFGVAVDDDGKTIRVAADDASAVATISGKYHSEHGFAYLSVTVPVNGKVKISIGQCTYSGSDIKVTNSTGEVVVQKTPATACWKDDKSKVTELYYTGEATTLTISGMGYCPYVAVEETDFVPTKYAVSYTLGSETAEGIVPEGSEVIGGETYTIAKNFTLYKEGYTLTGWTDGSETFATGQTITPTSDMTLTPVFTANTTSLADRTEPVTLRWTFRRDEGAPMIGFQNQTGIWVTQATVNGSTIDVKVDFDTNNGGKLANGNWTDWAQMNGGTTFTIPNAKGAVVSMEAYSEITTTTIDGQKDYTSGKTISYNIANTADFINIVIGDGSYYRYIQTILPIVQSGGGKTYTDEDVKVVFAMSDASNPGEATKTPDDAFSIVAFDYGDCDITGTVGVTMTDGSPSGKTGIKFKPSGNTTSLSWFVRPATGLTFTPTRVQGYINRVGTDSEKGVVITAKKADGETVNLGTYTAWRQGKDTNQKDYDKDAVYQYDITLTAAQQAQLEGTEGFYLISAVGVGNTKEGLFGEVTIEGKVNGTLAAVNKYTITIAADPEEGGSVSAYPKADEYIENDEVTLTAEKKFGYNFVNWTDKEGNVVSTEAKFKYIVTADETLTANFAKVNTYELGLTVDGSNDYMVKISPAPEMVEGKKMYEEGTAVQLNAEQYDGLVVFTNWSDGETNSGKTISMTKDTQLTAYYSENDIIAGWDFYTSGGNGRKADFASEENTAAALNLVNTTTGETQGWLDKSTEAAGGYETLKGAAVNWRTGSSNGDVGNWHWQTKLNAEAFTDIKVQFQMLYNYNAYQTYNAEYSLDGEEWTKFGDISMTAAKKEASFNGTLPAEANNQASLYIRLIADKNSNVAGTASPNDGNALAMFFITGTPKLIDDGKAPELVSSVPANNAQGASATGKIVLTFDERIKLTSTAKATLGTQTLTPIVSGKTVTFEYKGLEYSTDYTFTLAANSVADMTDNTLAEEININFTTMTRPAVTKALYDFIVPDNGTFKDALDAAAKRADTSKRFRIFVKKGNHVIPANKDVTVKGSDEKQYPDPKTSFGSPNVSIIGEDAANTSITNEMPNSLADNPDAGKNGQANPLEGIRTSGVLYLTSNAQNTYFQDIKLWSATADNTGRNVVLVDGGNKTICKNVTLWAYQDTYVSDREQSLYYFEGGLLRGRTDFICGSGDVFFNGVTLQMCEDGGYISVPRGNVKYGYVYKDCTIKGETSKVDGNYYLGRPWTEAAESYFIDTKMEAVPRAVGWADMSDGGCTRFAEYNSTTANGSIVDLSSRAKELGKTTKNPNNPILTAEEALEIGNLHNMFGDWDPTLATEQAPTPKNVILKGTTLTWDDSQYALLWAICKDGEVIDFTTEPTYDVDDATATYSVRAANEMGGLGESTKAELPTGLNGVQTNEADAAEGAIYNFSGQRVNKSYKGGVIVNKQKFVK